MLIPSDRHTISDLELWEELESADKVLSVNLWPSIKEVVRFTRSPCYCSVSWGKDSVLIAWLVARYTPDVPLVWVRPEGAENPHCLDVRDAFLSRFDVEYHEPVCPAEIWNDPKVSNEKAFRPASQIVGTKRRVVGVRADESAIRKLSMKVHGQSTGESCRPIGWLSTQDVFTALAQHDLPVHPNYAMLGGGRFDREHLRVASVGGEWGCGFGRKEWEQEYYADIINRMKHATSKSNR